MANPVLVCENGSFLYQIGRVGLDTGTKDSQDTAGAGGFAYTAKLRTEPFSPIGEAGKAHYRRVVVRVLRTGSFSATMRVYVDDVQTKRWSGNVQVDQSALFTLGSPASELEETLLEMDIDAVGTHIAVELEVLSTDVVGILLPESIEVHAYPIAQAIGSPGAESQ